MDKHLNEKQNGAVDLGVRFRRHARSPRNMGVIEAADGIGGSIGSCGDKLRVYLTVSAEERIVDLKYQADGCTFTVACASAISVLAKGLTIEQALQIEPQSVVEELGGLPEDHLHCARLAVNSLGEAVADCLRRRMQSLRLSSGEKQN